MLCKKWEKKNEMRFFVEEERLSAEGRTTWRTYRFIVGDPAFAVIAIFTIIRFPVVGPISTMQKSN